MMGWGGGSPKPKNPEHRHWEGQRGKSQAPQRPRPAPRPPQRRTPRDAAAPHQPLISLRESMSAPAPSSRRTSATSPRAAASRSRSSSSRASAAPLMAGSGCGPSPPHWNPSGGAGRPQRGGAGPFPPRGPVPALTAAAILRPGRAASAGAAPDRERPCSGVLCPVLGSSARERTTQFWSSMSGSGLLSTWKNGPVLEFCVWFWVPQHRPSLWPSLDPLFAGEGPAKATKMMRGLQHLSDAQALWELGLFCLEKTERGSYQCIQIYPGSVRGCCQTLFIGVQ